MSDINHAAHEQHRQQHNNPGLDSAAHMPGPSFAHASAATTSSAVAAAPRTASASAAAAGPAPAHNTDSLQPSSSKHQTSVAGSAVGREDAVTWGSAMAHTRNLWPEFSSEAEAQIDRVRITLRKKGRSAGQQDFCYQLQGGRTARSVIMLTQSLQQTDTEAAAAIDTTLQAPPSLCAQPSPPAQLNAAAAAPSPPPASAGPKRARPCITRADSKQWQDMLAFVRKSWPAATAAELDMIKMCKAYPRKSGQNQGRCEWRFQLADSGDLFRGVKELKKRIHQRTATTSSTHGEAAAALVAAPPSSSSIQQPSKRPRAQVTQQQQQHARKHTAAAAAGTWADDDDEFGPLDPDEAASASAAARASNAWPVHGELSWLVPAGHEGPRAALIPLQLHHAQDRELEAQQPVPHHQQQQLVDTYQSMPGEAGAAATPQPRGAAEPLSMEIDITAVEQATTAVAAAAAAAALDGKETTMASQSISGAAASPPHSAPAPAAAPRAVLTPHSVHQIAAVLPPAAVAAPAAGMELSPAGLAQESLSTNDSSRDLSQDHLQQLANSLGTPNPAVSKQEQQQQKRKHDVVKPNGLTLGDKARTKRQRSESSAAEGRQWQQQQHQPQGEHEQKTPSRLTMLRPAPRQLEVKDAPHRQQQMKQVQANQQQHPAAAPAATCEPRPLTFRERESFRGQQQQPAAASVRRPLTFEERQRLKVQQQQPSANGKERPGGSKQQGNAQPEAASKDRQRLREVGQDRQQQQVPVTYSKSGVKPVKTIGLHRQHPPALAAAAAMAHNRLETSVGRERNRDSSRRERPGKHNEQHGQEDEEQPTAIAHTGAADMEAATHRTGLDVFVPPAAEQGDEVVFRHAKRQRQLKAESTSQKRCATLEQRLEAVQQQLRQKEQQLQQAERDKEVLRGQLGEVQHLQGLLALLAQPELQQHCPKGLVQQQQREKG